MRIVTLTTDFNDGLYVAQLKAVILSLNPKVTLVDISHRIPPFGILEGAFVLSQVAPRFPRESIHMAVVDPGVGTGRNILLIKTKNFYLVGPDNGLFSLLLEKEKAEKIIKVDLSLFPKASFTFQGRDIFAPLVGYLSLGKKMEELGRPIEKIELLNLEKGAVVYIDSFGNIITNLEEDYSPGEELILHYKTKTIPARFVRTFGEAKRGEFIVLRGSSGWLEVDLREGSAAKILGVKVGERIKIKKKCS